MPDGQEASITLRPSPTAVGRVVRDGVPVPRILVRVVPDLSQFAEAEDVTLLRGGEATTDEDGRFVVGVPTSGGEVRVGDETSGMRRIPVASAQPLPARIDLGTIDLPHTRSVLIAMEAADGCELLFTGPAGRAGLTIARAARIGPAMFKVEVPEPGRWTVVGVCRGHERAVVPGTVEVAASDAEITIRLAWRE
jgi:hypothetical protein